MQWDATEILTMHVENLKLKIKPCEQSIQNVEEGKVHTHLRMQVEFFQDNDFLPKLYLIPIQTNNDWTIGKAS